MRTRFATVSLAALSLLVLAGCASPATPAAEPTADGACSYVAGGQAAADVTAPPAEPVAAQNVTLETSAGAIPMTFDAERTPCTVNSFVSLAQQGYFDDTECHRLTTAASGIYVLQCGDPSATGMGGPGYSFDDELDGSETYPAGTVAMANAGPDTNGSQFFLVYEDSQLPPSYTVFGQMDAAGLAVVREVAAAGSDGGSGDGAPVTPVVITGVTVD
ncbi:peptidylprolyl isomerase [Microbacterium sp. Gd 4-13]|uniref:peptidylprolyl isomerase n=1 Tax=Microbacterium sp. Gd 4-13 TaxID=2173179 RepID=UPI000D5740CE|nr:peptidylprolyl isomerase [Microbacterium sp. Gd 4-13]PVW05254.1 peptidylprolyl isomerase [Microbacterium sp. Gd 4-13]